MANEYEFFESLVKKVQLGPLQIMDANGKHGRVRKCLNKWYYGSESETANSLLVGGYGKNTEIRPPSDLDILFVLPDAVFTRFNNRIGNVQSQLLQEVKGVLAMTFPRTDVRGDGQIVSVPFESFAVEVLPAFALPGQRYRHADANDGGSWKTTDPHAERAALQLSNKQTGKTIHLIKLLKAWKRARNVKIKSFVLEMMAATFLAQWPHTRSSDGSLSSYGFYDWMMRDFFRWMLTQEDSFWTPAGTTDLVYASDTWVAQARFAAAAAERAVDHHHGNRPHAASTEWRNIFGDYTP